MKDIKDIKVSMVVAIYKVAPYLDKLIQSILNQTHENIEVILVDDGSPDESGKICDKYAAIDSRILVIHKSNGGGCEARNKGMELMTGEWFTIIDGDDWLEPDFVEYLLNIAVPMGAEMALTDSVFTTRDLKQNENDIIEKWTPEYASAAIIWNTWPMGCWNKLYNTAMWRRSKLSFDVPWAGEGMYFSTMSAQHSNYVAKGHKRVYNYRQNNPTSSQTLYDVKVGINSLWNIKNIGRVAIIRTPVFMHAVNWHIWKNYYFLFKLIIATNQYRKYWKEFLSCLWNIRVRLVKLLLMSEFSTKEKFSMLKHSILPLYYAHKAIKSERAALQLDLQNL